MTFVTIVGVTEMLCSFRLVIEEKTVKEILESSRLEFLEKFWANIVALSDTGDNTSGKLTRGGIADFPFFFWKHYWQFAKSPDSQVSEKWWTLVLLAYASLAGSRTLLQR